MQIRAKRNQTGELPAGSVCGVEFEKACIDHYYKLSGNAEMLHIGNKSLDSAEWRNRCVFVTLPQFVCNLWMIMILELYAKHISFAGIFGVD